MCADVDQRAIGMLAVDLGQRAGDLAQQIEADRLVVDRRTARAVGILDAADDQFAVGLDALFLEHGESHVRGRQREGGGHDTALGTGPHEGGIASRAQGQSQSSRAGWTCPRPSRR